MKFFVRNIYASTGNRGGFSLCIYICRLILKVFTIVLLKHLHAIEITVH